jgi:hypothetical protein
MCFNFNSKTMKYEAYAGERTDAQESDCGEFLGIIGVDNFLWANFSILIRKTRYLEQRS